MMKKLILTTAFLILNALAVFAQTGGAIKGRITDLENNPHSGVSIALDNTSLKTSSDAAGRFELKNIPDGNYTITVEAVGFQPQTRDVSVRAGQILTADFSLEVLTNTVDVIGRLSEYHTDDTTVATKIPARLIDVPQSITSVSPQLIADRSETDINDVYRNVAGVTQSNYSSAVVRGFTQREILFNGVRGNPYGSLEGDVDNSGFSTSILRLSNVERVEVLKGPASVLYGSGDAGGVINFVTKKPLTELDGTAALRFGQYGLAAGDVDLSVPLAKNLYARGAFFLEHRDSFRNNARLDNQNFIGDLLWSPTDRTRLSFEYEFIRQNQPGQRLRGVPVDANGRFITDISFSFNEPTDFVNLDANVWQANITQDFATDGRFEATARYLTNDRNENYHEPRGLLADGRTERREFRNQLRKNKDFSLTLNAYKPFDLGAFGTNTFNVGAEYYRQDVFFRFVTARSVTQGGVVPSIDIFNPVYGIGNPLLYNLNPSLVTPDTATPSRLGFYGQDQIALNKYLVLVAGGRYERFKDRGFSVGILRADDAAFTGRVGAVVKPREYVSIYGSFSNSYARPGIFSQTPGANGPHSPERGRQFEAGAKTELLNKKLFITASVFQINKTDVLRPDPNLGPNGNNANAVLTVGAIRNRGFEFDVNGAITPRLNVTFNYAYINSRITRDNNPALIGKPLANVSPNTVGFFTRYDITRSIGVGASGQFVDDRFEPFAGLKAPSYKVFDLSYYQTFFKRLRLNLKLENVADEVYATSSLFAFRAGNFPGQPRTFSASLTVLSFKKNLD